MKGMYFVIVLMSFYLSTTTTYADSVRVVTIKDNKYTTSNTSAYIVLLDSIKYTKSYSDSDSITKKYRSDKYDYLNFKSRVTEQSHYTRIKKKVEWIRN